jgi:uncharacterized membrane protein YhaH (DUF805 family)
MNFSLISGNAISDYLISDGGSTFSEVIEQSIGIVIVLILVLFGIYIYFSIAYSKIGEKAKLGSPGIAWMPRFGKLAIIFESSKMHWWPFLMMIIGIILGFIVVMFGLESKIALYIGIGILIVTIVVFSIMAIIWHWKTYEAVGRPGWWILVPIISFIVSCVLALIGSKTMIFAISIAGIIISSLGFIAHLVLIGIAAWGEGENRTSPHPASEYSQYNAPAPEHEMGEEYGYA